MENKSSYAKYILFPTLFYFVLVAVASPWVELRYVMPICTTIFLVVIYYLAEILFDILGEKWTNLVIGMILGAILISPIVFKIEPEVVYSNKQEVVEKLGNELNLPTIYCFNSENNRFLDDIKKQASVQNNMEVIVEIEDVVSKDGNKKLQIKKSSEISELFLLFYLAKYG